MKREDAEIEALIRALAVQGGSSIEPTSDELRALLRADRPGPLHFVNLLAFHPFARYPEGHELASRRLTGAEAYGLYGAVALRHVQKRGGRLVTLNRVEQSIIGHDPGWHQIATMEYPETEAFVDMIRDPDYVASLVHRDAGLARTLVLVSRPLLPGTRDEAAATTGGGP
jgi:uncharacterized protein (DUF1330 family)